MGIWTRVRWRVAAGACCLLGLILSTDIVRGDDLADLKAMLEAQQREIQALKERLNQGAPGSGKTDAPAQTVSAPSDKAPADSDAKEQKDKAEQDKLNSAIGNYLKEHPGAGMPNGTQVAWDAGFVISSTANPSYTNWSDGSAIPFSLRIFGRLQANNWYYHVDDNQNHLTGLATGSVVPAGVTGAGKFVPAPASGDYDTIGINRGRLWFQGTAFDPNLRYVFVLDGSTRGVATLNGPGLPVNGAVNPAGVPSVQGGNGIGLTDHVIRLFDAFVAYDFHPTWGTRGCANCATGETQYNPTFSILVGKMQPFFCLEEILGSGTQQFVSYSMANFYFDADDQNQLTGAAFQYRGIQDRLFMQGMLTNGHEAQTPNLQMDNYFGYMLGFWYDFGGYYNPATHNLELFGNGIPDIEYSCAPVLRVGGATNLIPGGRRSVYGNAEINRIRIAPGGPGGTSVIGAVGGSGAATVASIAAGSPGVDPFALDAVDSYYYDVFAAFKYRGLSIYNEWWMRNLENFRGMRSLAPGSFIPVGSPAGTVGGPTSNNTGFENPILYNAPIPNLNGVPTNNAALFPHRIITDFGTAVQAGYFLIPYKLEVAGRVSTIWGQSGDFYGDHTFKTVKVVETPAATAGGFTAGKATLLPVRLYNNAFTHFRAVNEYACGLNWYLRGNTVKFQTDCSWYQGGNPAVGGQSLSGWIPGVDGWMLRSQVQFQF